MILVIVGVLAVVAIPRFTGGTPYDARGYHDELIAAARYAQLQATTTGCQARFQVDPAGYSLDHENPCGSGDFGGLPIRHPSRGGAFENSTPSGVSVSVSGDGSVVFDGLGEPQTNTPPQVTVTGGGFNRSFCIQPGTGYAGDC